MTAATVAFWYSADRRQLACVDRKGQSWRLIPQGEVQQRLPLPPMLLEPEAAGTFRFGVGPVVRRMRAEPLEEVPAAPAWRALTPADVVRLVFGPGTKPTVLALVLRLLEGAGRAAAAVGGAMDAFERVLERGESMMRRSS